MRKVILKAQLAEFIARMWDEKMEVSFDPVSEELSVRLKGGGYIWVKVVEPNENVVSEIVAEALQSVKDNKVEEKIEATE